MIPLDAICTCSHTVADHDDLGCELRSCECTEFHWTGETVSGS